MFRNVAIEKFFKTKNIASISLGMVQRRENLPEIPAASAATSSEGSNFAS
jgi:hypothetical protein